MNATCTWDDGPDVLLTLDGSATILYEDPVDKDKWIHGKVNNGSISLTINEAENLIKSLVDAVSMAKDLNDICEEHDKLIGDIDDIVNTR